MYTCHTHFYTVGFLVASTMNKRYKPICSDSREWDVVRMWGIVGEKVPEKIMR